MLIGAHVSIAGGFDKCIDRAVEIGANCLQTFASSPRSLKTSEYPQEVIERYLTKKREAGMGPHFFHGVYLVNLATEKSDYLQVSIDSLIFYQHMAGKIHGSGTIFHLGSHKGRGFSEVRGQIVRALELILQETPDGVHLFLENAAGHSGVVGDDLHELVQLIEAIDSDYLRAKLAVCIDTQHAFASGMDLRTKEAVDEFVRTVDRTLGLQLVHVIHVNDSKVPFASKRDRHANIGDGEIGEEGFKALVNHPKLKSLPFILEVPGDGKSGPQKVDVEMLRSLAR